MSLTVSKPPNTVKYKLGFVNVFLAGSIEMGTAVDWQTRLTNDLRSTPYDIHILNPRRDDWDSSWVQSIENNQFRTQVEWELNCLEKSNIIAMYFDENTKSPISLLELGLHVHDNKLIVYCPEKFYRKGNVDIVCKRFNIPVFTSYKEWLIQIIKTINNFQPQ